MGDCRARSFITIMVLIAVCSLFLRFGLEHLIKTSIRQNESGASTTLKLISTALQNYAKDHQDIFPQNLETLTQSNPAYIDKDYIKISPVKGYVYSCSRIDASGYNCVATPIACGITGNTVYTITTGGGFISEKCNKKE